MWFIFIYFNEFYEKEKKSLFSMNQCADWNSLPFDLLAKILSFLSLDSLAQAKSTCKNWQKCANSHTISYQNHHHPSWFIAWPLHFNKLCYAHNPILDNWHKISLDFLPNPVKPIASLGSLLLLRSISSKTLQLSICNPFTGQFRYLPSPNVTRTNPALGVVIQSQNNNAQSPTFEVYVAGGVSRTPQGGTAYESKLEVYESRNDAWRLVGSTTMEFAVRLTVWTQNESVYTNGILYWITSARAFSVMGFEIASNICRELHVPMSDRLEFAALGCRNGRLVLVGGMCGGEACVWELGDDDMWGLVEKVPNELGVKLLGCNGRWINTKCVGNDEIMCLYKELGNGMVIWKESKEKKKWEWIWVKGCCSIRGKKVLNLPIKGLILQPSLSPFVSYSNTTS